MKRVLTAVCIAVVAFVAVAKPDLVVFDTIDVKMNDVVYQLEHAKTFDQRARGLMFRDGLCDDCGMLFTFDRQKVGSIWMKNTFIPLDLAYVDKDGVITDILPLTPHNLTSVMSSKPVSYAIEMNQGWFAEKGIVVGDRIAIGLQH